ncbi:MAG: methylmalonyl-CoA mutase family protein [Candidatus Nezhaarchaeota archaeon]|nr:methylmalonyl-CoA mutase family protein [Candidatus Nezhaarchaeota archaeon]
MFKEEELSRIREEYARWLEGQVKKTLEKTPERQKEFRTYSGIPLKPIYTPEDIKDLDYLKDLNFPGQYPFTRGIYPLMYRTRLYTMRQYTGFGTAEETNARFKYLLKHGETGLSIAFDLPTQMGYDPDHPLARGEVGKVGVSISTLRDYQVLYKDIPMDTISVHIQANANAIFMLAMHVAEGLNRGHQPKDLWGACQNDVLKEFIARGAYIYPLEPSMRLWGDVVEYCVKNMPRWQPVTVCQFHIQEAGANYVTAWGLSLANAIAYVEELLKRGLPIDEFAFNVSVWNIVCGPQLFEAVCGVRAARRLWAKIMKERFHAKRPASMTMRIFMGSGGFQMTRAEPLNNIVRGTISAIAGALAGVQAMNIQCYDEAYAIPTEEAIKLALRTEQIVAYEAGVTEVVDPLAGSYFVEWLTNQIEKELEAIIEDVESMGGAIEAIKKGYMQRIILQQAYEYQRKIETGELIRVGENAFVTEEQTPIRTFEVRPEVERERVEWIKSFRESRDRRKVREALDKLRKAAETNVNLVPYVIEAVKAEATVGEMADTLREVFGAAEDLAAL